ncbi:hypothetical protein LSTR_LSTR016308 [Laodelphax striatellus]|uniref:Peptidase S1 domain-containing protein n=1 Tax=Laodelphax striatellus TaxID=195883 RepID=A0A482X7Q7_LAOST|nr:hypothetical protein LSTR_LSTR016308 [Laodelphax striatellus]
MYWSPKSNTITLKVSIANRAFGLASWVKLGDLDTSTDKDDAKPEIFRIVARFNHPQYKPEVNYNDIALYRLDRKVVFNDYIRPICLQTDDLEEDTQKAQVAGWGRIGFGRWES